VSIVRATIDAYGEQRGVPPDLPDQDEALLEKLTNAAHRFGPETLDGLKKRWGDDRILKVTPEPAFEFSRPPHTALRDQSLVTLGRRERGPRRHELLDGSVDAREVGDHRLGKEEDLLIPRD